MQDIDNEPRFFKLFMLIPHYYLSERSSVASSISYNEPIQLHMSVLYIFIQEWWNIYPIHAVHPTNFIQAPANQLIYRWKSFTHIIQNPP